jgi:hypothetical protein
MKVCPSPLPIPPPIYMQTGHANARWCGAPWGRDPLLCTHFVHAQTRGHQDGLPLPPLPATLLTHMGMRARYAPTVFFFLSHEPLTRTPYVCQGTQGAEVLSAPSCRPRHCLYSESCSATSAMQRGVARYRIGRESPDKDS